MGEEVHITELVECKEMLPAPGGKREGREGRDADDDELERGVVNLRDKKEIMFSRKKEMKTLGGFEFPMYSKEKKVFNLLSLYIMILYSYLLSFCSYICYICASFSLCLSVSPAK